MLTHKPWPQAAGAAWLSLAAAASALGLLTAALALEHTTHHDTAEGAPASEHGQWAGFVWGALVGALIVLLFSYLSWRRQELQLEQIALERERLLAFEQRHLLLRDRDARHQLAAHAGSTSGSERGHSGAPPAAGAALAEALTGQHPHSQHPHSPPAAAGAASCSPSTRGGAASVDSGGTHSSLATPRRKSELRMIEEFLCTLVGRGSERDSRGSRSSAGGSITSSGPHSLPLGPSPIQSPLTRSGHQAGLTASGHAAAGQTRTDLAKLPAGFADISPADISLIQELGEGSYGEVWLASYCQTLVAVKIASRTRHANLTATRAQQETLRNLRSEASLMATLNHPNICRYLGACLDPPLMVMEYCAKRSLDALLADGLVNPETRKELTWDRLLGMLWDAANGMKFLHTRQPAPVAHRDLKSANLLVDSSWHVRVSDFGLSRQVDASKAASTVLVTNPRWLAPCVLSGLPGQLAADVWAFGTVMWEVGTWQLPFADLNPYQIIALVRERGTDSLQMPSGDQLAAGPFAAPGNYEAYSRLMRDCRASNPDKRPSFVEIVSRLSVVVERETAARHPELEADLMRRTQSSPAQTLKTFRLPPDGPAHKSAMAALERRRCALIQGRSSGGSSGTGSGGRDGDSDPAAGAAGTAAAGVTGGAAADGDDSSGKGGAAGSAPSAVSGGGVVCSSSSADRAAGAGLPEGTDSGSGAGSGDKAAEAAAHSSIPQLPAPAAAPAPPAAGAAASAAGVVFEVGTSSTDAPPSPSPVDSGSLDFARS